jgi:hypothetical protein
MYTQKKEKKSTATRNSKNTQKDKNSIQTFLQGKA